MRPRNLRSNKKGMTLTEVLITLCICAILGAIVIPAFGLANISQKKTADITNLHQLGVALQVYAIDSNDGLPPAIDPNNRHELCAAGSTWKQHLLPYLTTKTLFASSTEPGDYGKVCPIGAPIRFLGNYGASVFWATSGVPGGAGALKQSQFQMPSETFLIGRNQDSTALVAPKQGACPAGNGFATSEVAPRAISTWLLADGHVDTFKSQELYDRACWRWRLTKPLEFFH